MNRRARASIFESPVLTGAVVVLVMVIGIYISYGADRGLPFVPTYQLNILVPDAQRLVPGDAVHVGGARVGQVIKESAVPGNPPYSKLTVALNASEKVPVDSQVAIRPLSILGAKYVDLSLGHAKQTFSQGGTLPLPQSHRTVELNDAFGVFDPPTTRAIRSALSGLGDSLAGRGADLNEVIGATARLLTPLERVTRVLISPQTNLAGFLDGLDSVTSAIAPVAVQFARGTQNAATTLQALSAADTQFGQAVDQLPQTETTGTNVLRIAGPVLADAASIARAIRPGTKLLRSATNNLAAALEAGVSPLRRGQTLARLVNNLNGAASAILPPRNSALFNSLASLDAGSVSLHDTLNLFVPAQLGCNVLGVMFRNVDSTIGVGSSGGTWLATVPMINTPQSFARDKPSLAPPLHFNPYPVETYGRCEAGNEPFPPGVTIGPPAGPTGAATDQTSAPASSVALAQRVGLLTPPPGARP